jgi:p38 MAP kinase
MYLNHPDAQVVQLYNVFTPERSLNEFQILYFVFNFAGVNLHQVIRANRPFTEDHIRLIIYSLLRGLKFIHSAGIIHSDLKPSKIGKDQNSNITILDFGLASLLWGYNPYEYVAARWWRAPETIINQDQCTDKVDIWSVGCIMAELILLRTVFRGSDHIDQLNKIFDILGTPDPATLNEICSAVSGTASFISQLPSRPKQDFNQLFGFKYDAGTQTPISGVSPQGVDLLDRLLSFDHRKRPTAVEALAHPFFGDLRDPTDEPSIEPMIEQHHDVNHSMEMWKSLVWQLIEEFEPPSWINDDSDED